MPTDNRLVFNLNLSCLIFTDVTNHDRWKHLYETLWVNFVSLGLKKNAHDDKQSINANRHRCSRQQTLLDYIHSSSVIVSKQLQLSSSWLLLQFNPYHFHSSSISIFGICFYCEKRILDLISPECSVIIFWNAVNVLRMYLWMCEQQCVVLIDVRHSSIEGQALFYLMKYRDPTSPAWLF